MFTQITDHMMTRLHETHFGSSVNSIPCTVVHSPIEVSSLSPDQLHLTPISTIDGRTATGHERGRRSVVGGAEESAGYGGHHNCGGGVHQGGGGVHQHNQGGGVPHNQLAKVRLFPLGPAAPIDKMPHVQFRLLHKLHISLSCTFAWLQLCSFWFSISQLCNFANFRPNGTIFDCELGCFVPIEEYHRRRSKESLFSVKEENKENEDKEEKGEKEKGEKREKL